MNIIMLGASAAIARALAIQIGSDDHVILIGEDIDDLEDSAADIALRSGGMASVLTFDIAQREQYVQIIDDCLRIVPHIDGVFFCHDVHRDSAPQPAHTSSLATPTHAAQGTHKASHNDIAAMLNINITATCILADLILEQMHSRDSGFLVFLSASSADRGRQQDFIYGASKAALNSYVHGLQHRLNGSPIHALLVKLGPVDDAATWGMKHRLQPTTPTVIARAIWRAVQKRRYTIYAPWYWRGVMGFIRSIPRFLYHRI